MLIFVEQHHIDCGCVGDGGNCPVALAILAVLPAKSVVHVDRRYISFYSSASGRCVVSTPDAAAEFIEAFDGGEPVEPFEFVLPIDRFINGGGPTQ